MHPHRSSALGYASATSAEHGWVYAVCSAEAAASESSGLSVGGCPERWRYFGPYPVSLGLAAGACIVSHTRDARAFFYIYTTCVSHHYITYHSHHRSQRSAQTPDLLL
jgi:hypothetical protein